MDETVQYRAAKILIGQYGKEAKSHAMRWVFDMRAIEDFFGEWVWMGVYDAVRAIEANGTSGRIGQTIH